MILWIITDLIFNELLCRKKIISKACFTYYGDELLDQQEGGNA